MAMSSECLRASAPCATSRSRGRSLSGKSLMRMLAVMTAASAGKFLRGDGGVMAAEPERVVQDGIDGHFAGRVRHIIQITFRIRMLVIDGGRHDVGLDGLRADRHLNRARRAQHVAGRTL